MMTFIGYVKILFVAVVIPIALLNLFYISYYKVSLFKLSYLWLTNFSALSPKISGLIVAAIFCPIFLLPLGNFFDAVFLHAFGKKAQFVYVGEIKDEAYYINLNPPYKQINGPAFDGALSFHDIYQKMNFRRDPTLSDTWAGTLVDRMGFKSMLGSLLFGLAGMGILLGVSLYFLAPAYGLVYGSGPVAEANYAPFFTFLSDFRINKGIFVGGVIMFLFLGVFFMAAGAKVSAERHLPLPSSIYPGAEIIGIPIANEPVTRKERRGSGNDYKWVTVDTPYQDVFFKFSNDLPHPAYLYTRIHKEEQAELYQKIVSSVQNKSEMTVRLDEDLTFEVVN